MSSINKELINEQGICIGDRSPGGVTPQWVFLKGVLLQALAATDRGPGPLRSLCLLSYPQSILVITDGSSSLTGNGLGLYDLLVRY